MNRNFIIIFFLLLSGFLYSQNDDTTLSSEEEKNLSQAYDLDDTQIKSLHRILTKKYTMLVGIEKEKELNFQKYLELRRSIYKGTEGSIKLLLRSDQVSLYNEEAARNRVVHANRVKELKEQGAPREKWIDASMGIEW